MRVVVVPLLLALFTPMFVLGASCGTAVQADDDDDDDDEEENNDPDPLDPCEVPDDCSVFEACIDGFCRRECGPEDPCGGARNICDIANGACVECLEDVHCDDGDVCNSIGDCQPTVTTECTPNELGCIDDATAFVCSGDGSERIEAPCRDDQFCEAGACRTLVCEPNSVVCSGNALVICNADGTDSDAASCDGACDDDGFGCTCSEGSCEARACAAGEARCVGNSAQRCNADGLAFGDLEDCGDDSCVAGTCLPDECTPGDTSCSGAVLLTCDADGVGYDEVSCDQACVEGADGAACGDQLCEPLSQQCADSDTLVVCNASGTAASTQACGAGRFCEDGACQNEVCTPNARSCIGSDAVAVCNAQGSDETVTDCDTNEVCEGGQCIDTTCEPVCGTRECGPDPVCGASCGSCAGTCSSDGECIGGGDGPLLVVELTWTPTSQDMDLYLSREADGTMCITDTCSLHTCTPGDVERPDWDGSGTATPGDPLLIDGPAENPERIELRLDAAALELRVGADNVGPTSAGGSAAATSATIRLRLDGALVDSHVRTVPIAALWKGVQINWDGATLTSTDLEVITEGFDCTAPAGNACVTDSDCPVGQGCVDNAFFGGTCSNGVECLSDDDCAGFLECNGNHACALPTLLEWKQDCRNGDGNTDTANCRVGFHCDFFTTVCEEACPASGTAGTVEPCIDCCDKSGGDTCASDAFLGVSGNCEP